MVMVNVNEDEGFNRLLHTFCFVYEPAPGHSVMMSSFASLLVANAKATPENVVP